MCTFAQRLPVNDNTEPKGYMFGRTFLKKMPTVLDLANGGHPPAEGGENLLQLYLILTVPSPSIFSISENSAGEGLIR